jgi:hypothetical protein
VPVYVVRRYIRRRPGVLAWEVCDEYRTEAEARAALAKLLPYARLDALHDDGRSEPLDEYSRPLPQGQGRSMPR